MRIFHVLKELARRGHELIFLGVDIEHSEHAADGLSAFCHEVQIVQVVSGSRLLSLAQALLGCRPYPANRFYSRTVRYRVSELLRRHEVDVVLVNFLFMLEYLEPRGRERQLVVLDQHECDELLWEGLRATRNPLRRWFASINGEKGRRFQANLLPRTHALMCVSQTEADFMQQRLSPSQMLRVVPNGVDTTFFQPVTRLTTSPTVLFLGSLNVARNIDAIRWFCRDMWEAVRRLVPGAELRIVGTRPTQAIRRLGRLPGVHVVGPVEDVRPQYEQARVMIAPFRFGVGTRLKVLEAMAMGVPIVATPAGCCGINAINNQHALIAAGAPDFITGVVRVLTDDVLAQTLRMEARRLVEQRFEWKQIMEDLADWMEASVRARRGMTSGLAVTPGPPQHAGCVG